MGYQTNLVFQRGRPVLQAQPAERRKIWTVAATIAKSSATGIASRRIADVLPVRSSRANSVAWPDEVSRPFVFSGRVRWNFDCLE